MSEALVQNYQEFGVRIRETFKKLPLRNSRILITMAECANCGGHVTAAFVRVFALEDGTVRGCPQCKTYAEITDGDAG